MISNKYPLWRQRNTHSRTHGCAHYTQLCLISPASKLIAIRFHKHGHNCHCGCNGRRDTSTVDVAFAFPIDAKELYFAMYYRKSKSQFIPLFWLLLKNISNCILIELNVYKADFNWVFKLCDCYHVIGWICNPVAPSQPVIIFIFKCQPLRIKWQWVENTLQWKINGCKYVKNKYHVTFLVLANILFTHQ